MTNTFNNQDLKMINDLKEYAKAIKFELNNENDLKELLKKWVNHRVTLTNDLMDAMYNNYKKNIQRV